MGPEQPTTVQVEGLVKRYPRAETNAVDGLDFFARPGEVFGLLGPNGAGKSTTIGILTTQVRRTAGTARVDGIDVHNEPVRARSRFSVVPQRSNFDQALSARENLLFHAAYHGMGRRERRRRADELLEQFELTDERNRRAAQFSGGMQQRLLIARALMHRPRVLFLDEPSTGLDPAVRLFLWERIRELADSGITVILTTHDMDEAATLADRVGIVDHGRMLALDTPPALTRSLTGSGTLALEIRVADDDSAALVTKALELVEGVQRLERLRNRAGDDETALWLRLYLDGPASDALGPVSAALRGRGAELLTVELGTPTLEDVFIDLTGRDLR